MPPVNYKTTIRFQLFWTFIALSVIYLLFVNVDLEKADFIYQLLFIVFKPVFLITACVSTVLICFVVGLPIRSIEKLNHWWIRKSMMQLSIFGLGCTLLILSGNSTFAEMVIIETDGVELVTSRPNFTLITSGWFLTAFSILHFYPHKLRFGIKRKFFKSRSLSN